MLRLLCRAMDCVISGRDSDDARLMIESRVMGGHDSDDAALYSLQEEDHETRYNLQQSTSLSRHSDQLRN